MSTSSLPVALVREREWTQLVAAGLFLALACLAVGLQVENSVDLGNTFGVGGAREGRRFFAVYVAIVFSIGGIAAIAPRRLLWTAPALGGLALGTALVAVAIPGAEGWSILATLLTLTAAWFVGRRVLQLPGFRASTLAGSGMTALVVGLGLVGLAVFLLGLIGLIRWWTIGLATVLVGAAGLVALARVERRPRAAAAGLWSTRFRAAAAGILGVQGAYATIWAAAPDVQYDALQYKAWLPAYWAFTGEISGETFTDNPRSVYLGLGGLVSTPAHTVGAPGVGQYLQLLLAALFVVVAWRLGSRVGPTIGAVGALVVGLTPHVVWQSSTAYDDIFLTSLVLGGALAVLHFEGKRVAAPFATSIVVGFLAGTCIAGKLHLVPFALALMAVWCVIAPGGRDFLRRVSGVAVGVVVGAMPLLAYRWAISGNPVFPYYNNVFKSDLYPSREGFTDFTVEGNKELDRAAKFAWRLISDIPVGIEVAAPGVFGLLVAATIVAVLFGWRGDRHRRAVWGALVISLVLWWALFQYLRFALPLCILGVLVALPALVGLERLVRSRLATVAALALACVAAGAFIVSTFGHLWNVPSRWPIAVAVGAEDEVAYKRRALIDYAALEYIGEHARSGDGVIGQVWGRFHLPRDVQLKWAYELEGDVELAAEFADDPERFKAALDREGFRWVALADAGRQYPSDYFLAPLLDRYGQIAFADHLRDVYELVDEPREPVPVELCDESFSKAECWFGAAPPDGTPGVTAADLQFQPIGQSVPVCPGATYALTVRTGPGNDEVRFYFVFDVPNPEQGLRLGDVAPNETTVIHQTAPAGATKADLIVQPLGPSASLESMSLAVAAPPEGPSACA
jgi:hypothetical protein